LSGGGGTIHVVSTETAISKAAADIVPAVVVVRTPAGTLHLLPPGEVVPRLALFTVALLCSTTATEAPAVRGYDGPWIGAKACRVCMRVWRGDPSPMKAEALTLPGSDLIEPSEPRIASLPREHRGRPLIWCDWEPTPRLSHYSPACEQCGDPGPGKMVDGRGRDPFGQYVAFLCRACQHLKVLERVGSWDLKVVHVYAGRPRSR
jgi:hypothetical protein